MFISVDLPAPFSPSRQCTSPRRTSEVDAVVGDDAGEGLGDAAELDGDVPRASSPAAASPAWAGAVSDRARAPRSRRETRGHRSLPGAMSGLDLLARWSAGTSMLPSAMPCLGRLDCGPGVGRDVCRSAAATMPLSTVQVVAGRAEGAGVDVARWPAS